MRFHLLFLAMFTNILVSAQRNYVPGVITTLQNDSLKGFIDYRNWTLTPGKIAFKESLSENDVQSFSPSQIKSFFVYGEEELYVSRQVKMDITNYTLNEVKVDADKMIQDSTVFLLLMVKGNYNLYMYTDAYSRVHYIYDANNIAAQELQYTRKAVYGETGISLSENRFYRNQLTAIFQDCPDITKRIQRTDYRENDMRAVFQVYNHCKNPDENLEIVKKKIMIFRFGIFAGVSFNAYSMKDEYGVKAKFKSSVSPIPGVFMDIITLRNRQQYSLRTELLYKSLSSESDGKLSDSAVARFGFSYLQLNILLRYTYPQGKIRPFGNIGIGNAVVVSTQSNERISMFGYKSIFMNDPRTFEQPIIVGAGILEQKFSIEARYSKGSGFSTARYSNSNISSIQLLAGYRF
jgi:hypothetical protein